MTLYDYLCWRGEGEPGRGSVVSCGRRAGWHLAPRLGASGVGWGSRQDRRSAAQAPDKNSFEKTTKHGNNRMVKTKIRREQKNTREKRRRRPLLTACTPLSFSRPPQRTRKEPWLPGTNIPLSSSERRRAPSALLSVTRCALQVRATAEGC